MAITLLDGLLIGLMLVSGLLAMIRGLSRELLSVGSWVGAAAAAYFFYPQLSPYVAEYSRQVSDSKTLADLGAAALIFLVTLIVLSLVTMRIADFIVDSRIGALDRTLGFVFGAVRGALLVVVALLFYNWLVPDNQWPWIANAKSKPVLDQIGESIVQMLPEDPEKTFERVVPGLGGEEPGEAPSEAPSEAPGETQG
jgi:membrane protein required for colicin V production